jgi:hypothetical protein
MTKGLTCTSVFSIVLASTAALQAGRAHADSCERSRNYILEFASDDLPQKPQFYRDDLYKSCLQTLELPNVKDAFVLKVGAIAVLPRVDSVPATSGTLAQFCMQFPRLTLRFITRQESRFAKDIARVTRLPVSTTTSCGKITGSG